jgi:hypothetical protein
MYHPLQVILCGTWEQVWFQTDQPVHLHLVQQTEQFSTVQNDPFPYHFRYILLKKWAKIE